MLFQRIYKKLTDLLDVNVSSPSDGQVLTYDLAQSKWVNSSGGAGTSGFSGYSGFSGVGASGFSGYSGATGSNGANGANGASGFSGYSGSSGANGATGASGFSGFSGYSGTSGAKGTTGSAGTSGFSGYSGTSGAKGANGSAGASGFSGYSGTSGAKGTTGNTGNSGFSGYSGATWTPDADTQDLLTALANARGGETGTGIIDIFGAGELDAGMLVVNNRIICGSTTLEIYPNNTQTDGSGTVNFHGVNHVFSGPVTAPSLVGSGTGITALNASNISSGTLNAARLPTGIDAAKIGTGVVSNTEFAYLDGLATNVQSTLNIHGALISNAQSAADAVQANLDDLTNNQLGDMAYQSSDNVSISGGTIDIGNLTATGVNVSGDGSNTANAVTAGDATTPIKMQRFSGHTNWIDMGVATGKACGIGHGGPGANAWIGYAGAPGNWFNDSVAGDICYRAGTSNKLLFGFGQFANSTLSLSSGNVLVRGNVRVTGNLGVGNSAAATTLGSVVKKIEVFDANGTSLGYVPIYNSIS